MCSNVPTGHQCPQVKAGARRRPRLRPLRHGPNTSPQVKSPSKLPSCIPHFPPSSPETGVLKMQTSSASKETIFEENEVMKERHQTQNKKGHLRNCKANNSISLYVQDNRHDIYPIHERETSRHLERAKYCQSKNAYVSIKVHGAAEEQSGKTEDKAKEFPNTQSERKKKG